MKSSVVGTFLLACALATACSSGGRLPQPDVITHVDPNLPTDDGDAGPPRARGERCDDLAACAPGLSCEGVPCRQQSCPTVCAEACGPLDSCPSDSWCETFVNLDSPAWCLPRFALGAPCVSGNGAQPKTPENTCADGSFCSPSGTCVPQLAPGAACPGVGWPYEFACVPGFVCDGTTAGDPAPTCRPVAHEGDACVDDASCAEDLYCRYASQTWACAPRLALGSSCDARTARECVAGSRCAAGTPGGSCFSARDCPTAGESCCALADGTGQCTSGNPTCDMPKGTCVE